MPPLWFLLVAVATAVLHGQAALRPGATVATLGEVRLAVATFVERGLNLAVDPLPLADRLAAIQLAVVQLALPLAGVPVVEAARWACLALGALAALLAWPVMRGLGISAPATAVGVGLLGAGLPALTLHAGISAGAPAAVWLLVAAWFAVRQWGRAAVVAALLATLTAPLAGAALLALAAHLALGRVLPLADRLRRPVGGLLGLAAVAVAGLTVGTGPLAGAAGPLLGTPGTVIGVVAGLLLLGLAWRSADWMRPVLTAAVVLLLAALVPGPSRLTAALLVAPVLATAVGLLADQLGDRLPRLAFGALGMVTLVLAGVVPTANAIGERPSADAPNALLTWLITQPARGTPVRADELDRAELLIAGFPADQLRGPHQAPSPGELRLISDRPSEGRSEPEPIGCPGGSTVATVPRGTGGAPGIVCRTDGGAAAVTAEADRRVRLGRALADNPSLQLRPAAADAMRAGQVDPRLLLVLTALSTAHRISIEDFPEVELDAPAVPRRQALLTVIDDGPPASSGLLRTWLTAQQAPFEPTVLEPVGSALLVGFPAPPPGGLLPE